MTKKHFQALAAALKGHKAQIDQATFRRLVKDVADVCSSANGNFERIGQYPAGAMMNVGRKKQTTRLLKCECGTCGYPVRITKKWLDVAMPVCPTDDR